MKSPAQALPALPSQSRAQPFPVAAAPTTTRVYSPPQPLRRALPCVSALKEKPTALHRLHASFVNPAQQLDRLP